MDKFTKVYTALVIFTIFAFFIGWFKLESTLIIGILLLTTFFKGGLVIEYFMGLNSVDGIYRFIPTIWLITIITLIALGYYL